MAEDREKLLEIIVKSVPYALFAKDLEGRYLSINQAGARMFGLKEEAIIGRRDDEIFAAEIAGIFRLEDRYVVTNGIAYVTEEKIHIGGDTRVFTTSKHPLLDDAGKIIGVIGSSADITERRRAEESLQNERLLLRTVIDNLPDTICAKDIQLRKILSNPADVFAMGAHSEAEVLGKTDYDFYSKEFADFFTGIDRKAIQDGAPVLDVEREIPMGPSGMRWVVGSKLPVKDKDGHVVGLVGISRDISERKRAELKVEELLAEKELLLKEVHHRIKNNMHVINSILSLQRSTLSDTAAKQALEDAGARVSSMMVLYDRLYLAEGFREASVAFVLPSLIDDIIANYSCSAKIAVEKNIEEFSLLASKFQPLGLIVNEVLTNAMKHAFVGREEGRIRVKVAREGNRARIEIGDDGVGMGAAIDLGHSTGFGMMLIENLTRQLEGSLRIEQGTGTTFILEFSL